MCRVRVTDTSEEIEIRELSSNSRWLLRHLLSVSQKCHAEQFQKLMASQTLWHIYNIKECLFQLQWQNNTHILKNGLNRRLLKNTYCIYMLFHFSITWHKAIFSVASYTQWRKNKNYLIHFKEANVSSRMLLLSRQHLIVFKGERVLDYCLCPHMCMGTHIKVDHVPQLFSGEMNKYLFWCMCCVWFSQVNTQSLNQI